MDPFEVGEMLKGALGHSYGGPSIGFENGEFVLYSWSDAPVSIEIMCKHPDWSEFLKLVSEYSDTIPGDN